MFPGSRQDEVETRAETVEQRTQEIGRQLFQSVGRGPSVLDRLWWDDRLMALTMDVPEVKVQLFRFIDALPTLNEPDTVRRHLSEYLEEAGDRVPLAVRWPLAMVPGGPTGDRALAGMARSAARRMARRFIAGSNPEEAFRTILDQRRRRLAFTADLLGEAVITETEADTYQQTCLELLRGLAGPLSAEPEISQIDRDESGPIPRVNLSLKLTSLTPRFDALHAETTAVRVLERLRPILRTAQEIGAFVNVDMEQYAFKGLTYQIFQRVLDEPEFADWPHAGIVCQAYLRDAENDLKNLLDWARRRSTPVTVRLVKGAYWDYEVLQAQQLGWPIPVFTQKWQSDASFERCSRFLLEHREHLRPAFGSHNLRSLAHALALADAQGVSKQAFEVQILHGMGDPIRKALIEQGLRVRVYTPYGAMLPGMAYLVRRLLENTSNESFLKVSSGGGVSPVELLRDPEEVGAMWSRNRKLKTKAKAKDAQVEAPLPPFQNEPITDFSKEENRTRMRAALEDVRDQLGQDYPLLIDGEAISTTETLISECPSDFAKIVGRTARASREDASRAVEVAEHAYPSWSASPARERSGVLLRAAEIMRRDRFELAAWEVFECAKPWREADADVAEAIDFCEFYARQMIRLAEPDHRDVPGETNAIERFGRGVAVVIPPWNFPLAIPTGLTVAALVTGCPVVLKPAEQSPVVAWKLVEVLREAGLPQNAIAYLPGIGEEVGRALVEDSRVGVIAFTGSRAVGLEIHRKAAETPEGQNHVKRVIAEMGGKNAIIIDDDADLDEAVVGVLKSAFGYAGQKCSACARVIVLDRVYETFLSRLTEAVDALSIGPADDPDTEVPAVISVEAQKRILEYQRIAESEGRVVARVVPGALADHGHYVGPWIVADIRPEHRIAQEEVFGPLLAVLRANDLDDAIRIAQSTEYALTGGLYSRSPAHIDKVRREYRVGNLYINRNITGALVDRQPFGGFKLSGIGTKAGGTDFLLEFLLTRVVTENTMRRGFAPEGDGLVPDEVSSIA